MGGEGPGCIYVCYVGLYVLWVLVGLAKLHCGATPPSVMVFVNLLGMGGEGPGADQLVKEWNVLIFNLHVRPGFWLIGQIRGAF